MFFLALFSSWHEEAAQKGRNGVGADIAGIAGGKVTNK
jgi:hypothetical protein